MFCVCGEQGKPRDLVVLKCTMSRIPIRPVSVSQFGWQRGKDIRWMNDILNPGRSKDIWCHNHTFSMLANRQIRHLATSKVGYQPDDCGWWLKSSSGVCVRIACAHGLTYSLYHPEGIPSSNVWNSWIFLLKHIFVKLLVCELSEFCATFCHWSCSTA